MNINGNLKTPCNIYGICGCKQSGKNTVAKIWQFLDEWYNYPVEALVKELKEVKTDVEYVLYELQFSNYRNSKWQEKSFAHSLKQILCILYGFRIEQFEDEEFKSKELPESFWYWYMKLDGGYGDVIIPYTTPKSPKGYEGLKLIKPTPRMLLQKIGTDLFRNQLHPNTWVSSTFANYLNDAWIITDVRFPNELQAIKDRNGIVIRVNRNNSLFKSVIHESETILDNATFDYIVDNNSDIKSLIEKIKIILEKENIL